MRHTLATRSALAAATAGIAAAGLAAGVAFAGGDGATKTVTVTLKEFKLVPSMAKLTAGRTTFVAVNRGKFPHALALKGAATGKTAVLKPGASARFTVTLKNGAYTLWCPVGTHAAAGMKLAFRVGTTPSGGGGATTTTTPAGPPPTTTDGGYEPPPGY